MTHFKMLLYTPRALGGYSRNGMPVTEPNVPSTFITTLKLVVEETEFGFGWEASTANDCIIGETVVIGHDRPEVRDFHRNRSIESADLGVRRKEDKQPATAIDIA
jgi:hypothetical protein